MTFAAMADEIFRRAGVDKASAPLMWGYCVDILAAKATAQRMTRGMTLEKLKQALVDGMAKAKAEGTLA